MDFRRGLDDWRCKIEHAMLPICQPVEGSLFQGMCKVLGLPPPASITALKPVTIVVARRHDRSEHVVVVSDDGNLACAEMIRQLREGW